jgi:hypothetical protein
MATIKILFVGTILILFFSCKNKQQEKPDLTINIENKQLHYVGNLISDYNCNIEMENKYRFYANNIIIIKFTNNSNKPLLYYFNSSGFSHYYSKNCETNTYDEQGGTVQPRYKYSFDLIGPGAICNENRHFSLSDDSLQVAQKYFAARILLDSLKVNEYLTNKKQTQINTDMWSDDKQWKVIYPNQSQYYFQPMCLPLTDYRRNLSYDFFKLDSSKDVYAQFTLTNVKSDTIGLTDQMRMELKTNKYTIFEGTIKSNKVPVKMVRMPE